MRLQGRAALVTGGGSGIGRALAACLAAEGAAVLVVDIDTAAAHDRVTRITAADGRATVARADVTRAEEARQAVAACVGAFGGLDSLANGAGVPGPVGRVIDAAEEAWDRLFAVNVKGPFLCAKPAVPEMQRRGRGAIVNIASTAGLVGSPVLGPYGASASFVTGVALPVDGGHLA